MPIFWDCQANVGVNTIRENSVEIHFFLCQPQIPCLPCKDVENTIFFCFGIFKYIFIYYRTGFSHSNEVDVTIEDITDATLFTPNVPICKLKRFTVFENFENCLMTFLSIFAPNFLVEFSRQKWSKVF